MITSDIWPAKDYSRVPYRLYFDQDLYDREQARIFQGNTWVYVGLACEIPNSGDFKTTYVGESPVIIQRRKDGSLAAMLNRCGHRGARVRREAYGNDKNHTCIYHRWCYDESGKLIGIPFRRGVKGKGGLDADFQINEHGLRALKIATYQDAMFCSFGDEVEPLEDYLGAMVRGQLDRLMHRPLQIIGYQRQRIEGNWKFYQENLRDTYHASLLHEFFVTFGLDRVTNEGGIRMDDRHRHMLSFIRTAAADDAEAHKIYAENNIRSQGLSLEDSSMLKYVNQYNDNIGLSVFSVFPIGHFQQMSNALNTRQVIPRGPHAFEIVWTFFGYADDDAELRAHRRKQTNFLGPAGYVSMEDSEAIEILHASVTQEQDSTAMIEMGGKGPIRDLDNKVNDVPIRGFWSYYSELLDIEPAGAER